MSLANGTKMQEDMNNIPLADDDPQGWFYSLFIVDLHSSFMLQP
jgi:hypothetical protein